MAKGKFIVIDGTDGVGKATQTALLTEALRKKGVKVKKIDFPGYYDNFFGELIGDCLAGKYGDFIAVDPHVASVLYAADRWESSEKIRTWLSKGYTVIADRYVSSNQIHQGGKIRDAKKRIEFLLWLDRMEHSVFKIPRPDAIIYLHMPVELSLKLLQEKSLEKKKRYLEGKKDLAENDVKHLRDSQKSAISIVGRSNKWYQIECARKGSILPREEIHDMIFDRVKRIIKLS